MDGVGYERRACRLEDVELQGDGMKFRKICRLPSARVVQPEMTSELKKSRPRQHNAETDGVDLRRWLGQRLSQGHLRLRPSQSRAGEAAAGGPAELERVLF
jgi:hypothetical protein